MSAGSWPGRHLAASRSSACYRNRWDHRDHRDRACLALRTRNRLAGFARANGLVRQHCLFTGHLLGAAAWLAISRRSRWSRWSRSAHWKMKSLAGGPATGPPSASPLAPRASGFAVRASVRAPLARHWSALGPCRGTKGFYPGKRPWQKARPPASKFFFTFFHKPPCALSANVIHLRQFKGQNRLTMGL